MVKSVSQDSAGLFGILFTNAACHFISIGKDTVANLRVFFVVTEYARHIKGPATFAFTKTKAVTGGDIHDVVLPFKDILHHPIDHLRMGCALM